MRYLDRPKTAGPSLARAPALYQSVPAGNLPTPFLFEFFLQDGQVTFQQLQVSAHRDRIGTFSRNGQHSQGSQERLTSLTSALGTIAPNIFKLERAEFFVLTLASLVWVVGPSSTSRWTLGSRVRRVMRGWVGAVDLRRHQARGNPIGLRETSR